MAGGTNGKEERQDESGRRAKDVDLDIDLDVDFDGDLNLNLVATVDCPLGEEIA